MLEMGKVCQALFREVRGIASCSESNRDGIARLSTPGHFSGIALKELSEAETRLLKPSVPRALVYFN